jgi:hypothetical protein
MNQETLERGRLELATRLRAQAKAICEAQPGYGTPSYRGDPYNAVAIREFAEHLDSIADREAEA